MAAVQRVQRAFSITRGGANLYGIALARRAKALMDVAPAARRARGEYRARGLGTSQIVKDGVGSNSSFNRRETS